MYRVPMNNVESSSLSEVGYDAQKQILAVRFTSGAIYHYAGVSENDYASLLEAESLGKHFAAQIRGKHQAEKMSGTCDKCGDKHGYIGDPCMDCGCSNYQSDRPDGATS